MNIDEIVQKFNSGQMSSPQGKEIISSLECITLTSDQVNTLQQSFQEFQKQEERSKHESISTAQEQRQKKFKNLINIHHCCVNFNKDDVTSIINLRDATNTSNVIDQYNKSNPDLKIQETIKNTEKVLPHLLDQDHKLKSKKEFDECIKGKNLDWNHANSIYNKIDALKPTTKEKICNAIRNILNKINKDWGAKMAKTFDTKKEKLQSLVEKIKAHSTNTGSTNTKTTYFQRRNDNERF